MPDTPARLDPVTCELWLPRGPDLPCEVLRLTGREALSQPFSFEIEIWCDDADAPLAAVLGADVELLLERGGLERRVFGLVAEVDVRLSIAGRSERDGVGARLLVVPAFALLEHEVETRFFAGQTVVEILSTLLGERLGAYERSVDVETRLAGSYHARDYCVQFRESTFAFCSRLMEEEGIAYFFAPDDDAQRERMVLVDANEHYAAADLLVAGPIAIERDRPEELPRESIQTLDFRHALASTRVVARGYNYKLTNAVDEAEAQQSERRAVERTRIHEAAQRQIIDDPLGDPLAQSFDGSAIDQQLPLARRVLDSLRSEAGRGHGRGNAIGFAAGTTFELEQSLPGGIRSLLLCEVEHHVQRDASPAAHGCSYHNEFRCIPSAQAFRPRRATPKPRVHGVQTGIVVGKQPDEVHTDKLGRVQVMFPMPDREGLTPSCWIRVAQMWAGPGYGAMVIPRVGMEVVVSFVDGDPDQPLITGCVYNANNQTPYPLPEELSKSTFKSSSTPGGEHHSELRIEDAAGSEQVFVRAQRRMDLRVAGTLFETATGGRETTVGAHPGAYSEHQYEAIEAWTVLGEVHQHIRREHRLESTGNVYRKLGDTKEAITGRQTTWVNIEHQLTAPTVITEASDTISEKAKTIVVSGSDVVSIKGGARVILESNNSLELRVGNSFISLHQGGIDMDGGEVRIGSGGVGSAEDAKSVEAIEIPLPFEALPADDGRGRTGGGGGGGGGRSRDRGSMTYEPHSAPPMAPAKLVKPKTAIEPKDEVGTWVRMEWQQEVVWCSEKATLSFVVEGVPAGAHQSGFIVDATSGELLAGFGVEAAGNRFEIEVSIADILPAALTDGTVQTHRDLKAQLSNGLITSKPLRLQFMPDMDTMFYDESFAKFSIGVQSQAAVIEHVIPFVRGFSGQVLSLGYLAEGAGGLLGIHVDGFDDWRYGKAMTIDGDPDRLAYWDGEAWYPVDKDGWRYHNALGTRRWGFPLWYDEHGVLQQRLEADFPWPDPVKPEWEPKSLTVLQSCLERMAKDINDYWSKTFDLHRDACRGTDPKCCRYPIACRVSFVEIEKKIKHGIVITENETRADAGSWPLHVSKRTAIHEFGHHLGNPDEYPGASVDIFINGDGAKMGIDEKSIMGSGMIARRRHLGHVCDALTNLIEERLGRSFTFTVVDKLR